MLSRSQIRLTISRLAGCVDRKYLLTAGVIGLLYVIVTPPFQVPDEPNHFYRCYQVTRGEIFSKRLDNLWGGELPRSLVHVVEDTAGQPGYQPEFKVSLSAVVGALGNPLRPWRTMFVHFPNTAIYSPAPYLPQAAGILLGRLLGASPLMLLYLGRFANVTLTILLCAAAIRLTAAFGQVLFLVAATPMFIYEAASVSADALTDALSLLFIALVLRCAFGPDLRITKPILIAILTLVVAIGLCKNVYWILAFLVFIIPAERFGSRPRYLAAGLLACLLSVLASYAWFLSIKPMYVPYLGAASLDDPAHLVLAHPFLYAKLVIFNLLGHLVFYVGSFVGYLGWEDTPLPPLLIAAYISAMCWAGICGGKARITSRNKLVFGLVALVGVCLVIGSQLFLGKPGGGNWIDRSQGRYFTPIAPLVFFLLANEKLAARFERCKLQRFVPYFALAALVLALAFVIRRYYIA